MYRVQGRPLRLPEKAVVLSIFAILVLAAGAMAQSQAVPKGTPGLISLDVVDADLSQVVRVLMSESKQSIVIGDQDVKQKKVTAMLNDVPLETALKYVVESVGCSWRREADGVYIISKFGSKPDDQQAMNPAPSVPLTQAIIGTQGRLSTTNLVEARRETKVETIKLHNAGPVELMWLMGLYKVEQAPQIEKLTVKPGVYIQGPDGGLNPVIEPGPMTPPLTESLRNDPGYAQRAADVTQEAAQFPPGVSQGRSNYQRPGQPTAPGAPQGGAQQSTGLLPEGVEVWPYELDNSLIVRGDEEGIEELKTIISKLDIAPRQIMIEARFVSIATSELESLGVNWSLERMATTFSTQFAPAGNILVGYANGNLMANLRANASKTHGRLINAPIVTTMNNVPATIMFQTTVPYLNSTLVFNQSGTPTSTSQTLFLPITSQLWVLPRINNADNSITVTIMPQISDIEKFVSTANGDMPIVNSQIVQTVRRVGNGETIVLGGLIRKEDNVSTDKIPLLGDLPLVGPLFRSTKKTVDDKELLIFLTPTIVPEKPVAGSGIGVMP
jgi:general secretion pathway protein D